MRNAPFPQTKDERFLLEVGRLALESGNSVISWVSWQSVADRLRYGSKSAHNMMNILARTFLIQKKGDEEVRLTHISFRHYGEPLCKILQIELPNFDEC